MDAGIVCAEFTRTCIFEPLEQGILMISVWPFLALYSISTFSMFFYSLIGVFLHAETGPGNGG
jgi:hypothetical protein